MNSRDQIVAWVYGIPIHNIERDECCPDFSCCNKAVETPIAMRRKFLVAWDANDEQTQLFMLGMFLSGAIGVTCPEKSIYIAGQETEQ